MNYFKLLYVVLILISSCSVQKKTEEKPKETAQLTPIEAYHEELNREYREEASSPLYTLDRLSFKGHDFFPINQKYVVKAQLVYNTFADTIAVPTSSGAFQKYIPYAEVQFVLDGKDQKLTLYKSVRLASIPKYANYLFLPFRDQTNGVDSYGGGRYIDLKSDSSAQIIIDFNRAYNPYCAYSEEYNCPIVPNSNYVSTRVEAGVRLPGGSFEYHKD